MNAEISETIRATIVGLGMQIPEIPAQRKFVSAECHAHNNAHKPPKTVGPKKKLATPTLMPTNRPQTWKNRKYERGNLGNYQR